MFYLIQSDELANAWCNLVSQKNGRVKDSPEEELHLEELSQSILYAIQNQKLKLRNSSGATLPPNAHEQLHITYISLQDFCSWGNESGANLGTPESEFELAYMLGIHTLELEENQSNQPTPLEANKPALKIKQVLSPDTSAIDFLRNIAKNEPWHFFTEPLRDIALSSTPPILILRNEITPSNKSSDTQNEKLLNLGLKTTDICRFFAAASRCLNEDELKKTLGNHPIPKWLSPALLTEGSRGGHQRKWDPVLLAVALVSRSKLTLKNASQIFIKNEELKPWFEKWSCQSVYLYDD